MRITWRQLYRQFDANPTKTPDKQRIKFFRRKVLRELKKIKIAWPDVNYATDPGVFDSFTPRLPPSSRHHDGVMAL